jgi:hypothetical protein
MDTVLGHKPATEPPVVVESGAEPTTSTAGDNTEDDVDEETDLGGSRSDEQETISRSETPVVDTEKAKTPVKGKKRKKSGDKMDRMETLVEKVMKMQNESEQHYLRLEEKMMEMEEQRQGKSRLSAQDDGNIVRATRCGTATIRFKWTTSRPILQLPPHVYFPTIRRLW